MRTGVIIQCRMASTRFPGKALKPLPIGDDDYPVLRWVIRACLASGYPVYVATSTNPEDDAIENYVHWIKDVPLFRGDPIDVLDRIYRCAELFRLDEIVRITGDCPFVDPDVIRQVVALRRQADADYASNVDPPTWPDGLDVQCVTMEALRQAWEKATDPTNRDTVLQYIVHRRRDFKVANLRCPIPGLAAHRWVLDTQDDYTICSGIAERLLDEGVQVPRLTDILKLSHIKSLGEAAHELRNERYLEARAGELKAWRFTRGAITHDVARRYQPYMASTYSKSHVAWGFRAPLYLTHAQGSRVWDVDGNEFIDMTAGLGTTILGHADPYVRSAIERQLDLGIAFPLAHDIEHQVARKIVDRIMPDGKVVFGKNGSDVTSAAMRVARVFTGNMMIVKSIDGYHGWHEWALAGDSSRNCGLIDAHDACVVRAQEILNVPNSNLRVAAYVVEPNKFSPEDLSELIEAAHAKKVIVIFDEMVTTFRYPKLTYAATYGLEPDLICLGKALGNGMPITALVGRTEIMDKFVSVDDSPYAFYSGTHFGETLSLAAAGAVIDRMTEDEQTRLCAMADMISQILEKSVTDYIMSAAWGAIVDSNSGSLPRINFVDSIIAAKFRREMAHNGVLVYSLFLPTLAHSDADLAHVGEALERTFKALRDGTARGGDDIPGSGIMRS